LVVAGLLLPQERGVAVADYEGSTIVWRKSRSSNSGGCVEVAFPEGSVLIRDSKNKTGPLLSVSPVAWAAFLIRARNSEFDLIEPDPRTPAR
jgi:Domain of unknown function (DUF397)